MRVPFDGAAERWRYNHENSRSVRYAAGALQPHAQRDAAAAVEGRQYVFSGKRFEVIEIIELPRHAR